MLAVCGIVRRKGRVLVCKRAASMAFPGFWEPPTEFLEDDETLEDALDRVLFERLTVSAKSERALGALDFSWKSTRGGAFPAEGVRLWGYEVELRKNFVHIYGYDGFRWAKPQDLKRLKMFGPHVTLLTGGL